MAFTMNKVGSLGAGVTNTAQSMIRDKQQIQQTTKQQYRAPINTLTQLSQQPLQLLEAYKQCLQTQSFKADFYNLGNNDQFEKVTCESFYQLDQKATQQENDLKRIVCVLDMLNKATNQLFQQKQFNKTLLKDLLLRQLQINLSIISKVQLTKDLYIPNYQQRILLVNQQLSQQTPTINSAQLHDHCFQQLKVVNNILDKIQGFQ